MLFHSPEFILLMLGTLAIYIMLPKLRLPVLALANLFFYGVSGWQYLLLFAGVLTLTHLCAVRSRGINGKVYLWIGVLANLVNLVTFKYTYFAVSNLKLLAHLNLDPATFRLILPVGISFYTFHLIAYLVDVYHGEIPPARNLLECWVFTAFFGQLIAGPIMRGRDFLPQIQSVQTRKVTWDQVRYGIYLFTLGLAKKVLLSDTLGHKANTLWSQWATLSGLECWIAGWLFAFQIYYDFSAYSEMALGIGYLFGFELTANFRTPYLAQNPAEFWRRWHITLSTWIRDYLYIPLGGNRDGEARSYLYLLVAMALSGLWHGAAWTFVIWGVFHGLLAVMHKVWVRYVVKARGWQRDGWVTRWGSVFLMFQATTVGWIFFRGANLTESLTLLAKMFNPATWLLSPLAVRYLPVIALLALLHVGEFWLRKKEGVLYATWRQWAPSPVRAVIYTAAAAFLLIMTELEQITFIYFQF